MRRLIFLSIFFFLGVSLSLVQDVYEKSVKSKLMVNPQFYELKNRVQVGDLIIINSENFLSSLFKRLDNCGYSSFKVVVDHNNDKMILVSDIDTLSDEEGFYLSDMEGFFSDYDQVHISLWRPRKFGNDFFRKLEELKLIALQNNTPYDFTYNYRSKDGMSCIKMIQEVYGLEIFDDRNFTKFPIYNPLMCDLKLEEYFAPIMAKFPFWIKDN